MHEADELAAWGWIVWPVAAYLWLRSPFQRRRPRAAPARATIDIDR